jgi:hypothetical protein
MLWAERILPYRLKDEACQRFDVADYLADNRLQVAKRLVIDTVRTSQVRRVHDHLIEGELVRVSIFPKPISRSQPSDGTLDRIKLPGRVCLPIRKLARQPDIVWPGVTFEEHLAQAAGVQHRVLCHGIPQYQPVEAVRLSGANLKCSEKHSGFIFERLQFRDRGASDSRLSGKGWNDCYRCWGAVVVIPTRGGD